MADQEYKPKDVYVAAEDERRQKIRAYARMKAMGDAPLESDLSNKNLISGAMIAALPFMAFMPEFLGGSAELETVIPKIADFLWTNIGAGLGGKGLKKVVEEIAPNHPYAADAADLVGNVIGGLAMDPASLERLTTKFSDTAVREEMRKLVEQMGILDKSAAGDVGKEFEHYPETEKPFEYYGERGRVVEQEAKAKVDKFIEVVSLGGTIREAMYNSMLWVSALPMTKILNDTLFLPVQTAFRGLGVAIEHGPMAGWNAMATAAYGYRAAFKDAIHYGFGSIKEDSPLLQIALKLEDKTAAFGSEAGRNLRFGNSPVAQGLRYIWATFGGARRSIMGADQFAKTVARGSSRRMGSYMMALDEADTLGLKGAAKLHYADMRAEVFFNEVGTSASKALNTYANNKMFEDTFTDMGPLVKWLSQGLNTVPGLRFLVPMLRVPANLIKQGVAISPLAPLTSTFRAGAFGANKIEQDVSIAKWIIGSMAVHHLWHHAASGRLIGNGPQGPAKDMWEHHKHRNSIKIGDHYYGFEHLGPAATVLSMAADTADMYSQTDDHAYKEQIGSTMQGLLAEKASDTPLLKTLHNVSHAIDSWKQGGSGKAAEEFVGQQVSEFIPGIVREIAHVEDPAVANARNAIETLKENIPGYSTTVYPKRDRFGHVMYSPVGSGPDNSATKAERIINTLSPVPMRGDLDIDPVDKELFKYGKKFTPIPEAMTFGKGPHAVTAPISEEQQDTWAKQAGHGLKLHGGLNQHDYMLKIIKSPKYQNADPGTQSQMLTNAESKYRIVAAPKMPKAPIHQAMRQMKSMKGGEMGTPLQPQVVAGSATEQGKPAPDPTLTAPVTVDTGLPKVDLPKDTGEAPLVK